VLGREPVVDQRDHRAGAIGQLPSHRVELVQRADHPAATVVVDDHRVGRALRHQHPHRDRVATGDRHPLLAHRRDLRARAVELAQHVTEATRLRRRHLVQRLRATLGHPGQQAGGRLVESHRWSSPS
jgi:hypothetical protein